MHKKIKSFLIVILLLAACSEKKTSESNVAADTTDTVAEKKIPYGNNPGAGKYLQVDDAKIYYEVYGQGPPLLLLHGDFYGHIGEFEQYYPILSKHYTVIAVGRRGHAQSEMGKQPFTVKLFADDALAVLRNEKFDKATVVGFSAGAITGYYLAAYYPETVTKLVALAGALNHKEFRGTVKEDTEKAKFSDIEKNAPDFVAQRKKLMPEPERFEELFERLKKMWLQEMLIEDEKAKNISSPVLIVTGDRDYYFDVQRSVQIYKTIPGSQLAVIPNCDHVGLIVNPDMFKTIVMPFLTATK